ncbi:MAG TPA: hypothetical protein VJB94_05035 [Candidatus Nanoarchaeia archaeon]|nr:hypothetical protein [Candidatus Nanoarchaeia archaeon]
MANELEQTVERQIIELVAVDRLDIPISSMSGKLKRRKPSVAKGIDLSAYKGNFSGERAYANVETEDKMKARGIAEGIDEFERQFPRYGAVLRGLIAEKRIEKETHLYFGLNEGRRLTSDDYKSVMTDLGFSEGMAESLYTTLMDASRKISKARVDEERSILIG